MDHVVDLLPEMGVTVLLMFDPKNDIGFYKKEIGDRVALKGNVNPLKFLRFGTPETVKAEVKRQLDAAKEGGGYIVSTGGEMGDGTPDENIFALIEAVEEYGKY
jgi:uroporphyrinogen decarboxylase